MASTTVIPESLAKALNEADPNRIADALRILGIGVHLSPQKWAYLGTTGATSVVFGGGTSSSTAAAAFIANASAGLMTPALPSNFPYLLPALSVATLRVTTGASGVPGLYMVADASYTAALYPLGFTNAAGIGQIDTVPGVALLSDDGTTLTFPAQASGFVIEYIPRSNQNVLANFEHP